MSTKKEKQILYLTYDGLTDPLGQSQVLPYIKGLCAEGFKFHIISFEKPDRFAKNKHEIKSQLAGLPIIWHPKMYHKNPPVLSAIFDLWVMQKLAVKLQKQIQFQSVWCRSYMPGMVGMNLKDKFGVPFIFDMRGFWADERVEGGTWPQNKIVFRKVYQYFKQKEKQMLAAADHVVVLTHKAKEILLKQQLHGNPIPKEITVIPCCVDTDLFDPSVVSEESKDHFRSRLGISPTDKILVYSGSLGTWYLADEMLQYFHVLYQEDSSWKFLVITKDNSTELYKMVQKFGIFKDSIVITSAERKEMPILLSLATKAISYIMPSFSKQASSPTKLAEYLAMGLPCECNSGVGDVDRIMEEILKAQNGSECSLDDDDSSLERTVNRAFTISNFSIGYGVQLYKHLFIN